MFDTIHIKCPECGLEFEQQSKDGPCILHHYYLAGLDDDVPAGILEDLAGRDGTDESPAYNMKCPHCSCQVAVIVHGKLVGKPIKRPDHDEEPETDEPLKGYAWNGGDRAVVVMAKSAEEAVVKIRTREGLEVEPNHLCVITEDITLTVHKRSG